MKTCKFCKHFEIDNARSKKLGEPIGICQNQIDKRYEIGCFDVEECDGFDEREEITNDSL